MTIDLRRIAKPKMKPVCRLAKNELRKLKPQLETSFSEDSSDIRQITEKFHFFSLSKKGSYVSA